MNDFRAVRAFSFISLILVFLLTVSISEEESPKKRHFEFIYSTLVRDIPPKSQRVEVWIPYPASDNYQKISNVKISSPYPTQIAREPEYGNQILYLIAKPPLEKDIQVELKFEVIRTEYVGSYNRSGNGVNGQIGQIDLKRLLSPDALVPLDGRIKSESLKVTEGKETPLQKARAIYNYVTKTVKYDKSGEGWGKGDALYACDIRRGNCTDFHSLIIGMSRAAQIPAIFEIGFPLPNERGSGDIPGYHCWAELHISSIGWLPIDSSEASKNPEAHDYFFGRLCENRLQMSVGRDLTLVPKQNNKPLNYFIYPYVEVDGKIHDKVESRFSYSDDLSWQKSRTQKEARLISKFQ